RAIVFVIGDFLGTGYDRAFRRAARKHDLIAVRTADPRERDWPAAGLVRLRDAETGAQVLVDTGDRRVRAAFAERAALRAGALTVEGPAPLRVELPKQVLAPETERDWKIQPAGPAAVAPLPGGRERWAQAFRLDPYVAGEFRVEFAPVKVNGREVTPAGFDVK